MSCFRNTFRCEYVNGSQKLPKSAEKQFYATFSSIRAKLSDKKLFLVRFEIRGRLTYMFTPNHMYIRPNKTKLPLPFEMQISEKLKTFCGLFIAFSKSALNL